ncbi:MAG: hypothetical protein R3F60_15775 [bacterium]
MKMRARWWWALALVVAGCAEDPESAEVDAAVEQRPDARVVRVVDMAVEADAAAVVDMDVSSDGAAVVDGEVVDAAPRAACGNGLDDDGDGLVDFPDDPGCQAADDDDEFNPPPGPECDDRVDNDGDGLIDVYDPDCSSDADPSEEGGNPVTECSNGLDDDENGFIDFPADPGCHSAGDVTEGAIDVPECANEQDDDGDGAVDYPVDPGCAGRGDRSEDDPAVPAACANGVDDDGNGATDWPDDPGCEAAGDPVEQGPCGDGVEVVDLNAWMAGHDFYDGTTVGAPATGVGSCGGAAGGERAFVYRVDRPLEALRFSTDHPETRSPTVLYLRTSCLGPSDLLCNRGTADQPGRTLEIENPRPGTYFLIVDTGSRDGGGPFRLTVDAEGPPQCRDFEDNDGDGLVDAADPGCTEADDRDELDPDVAPICSDGVDNDMDGQTDWPDDMDCQTAGGPREEPLCPLAVGAVIEVGQDGGVFEMPILPRGPGVANGTCEVGASPEVLLVLDLDDPSDVFVDVLEGNAPAMASIYARTDCADAMTQTGCRRSGDMGPLALNNLDRGLHYIFVEQGFLELMAARTVTVVVQSNIRACNNLVDDDGDGLIDLADPGCEEGLDNSEVDPAEVPECSDGIDNDDDGLIDWPDDDGCFAAGDRDEAPFCLLANDVVQVPPQGGRFNVDTRGGMNQYQANCAGNAAGPEKIFSLNLARAATVTAEIIQADYDTAMFMRSTCDDQGSQLACDDDGGQGLWSRISVQVQPGTTFIFVDGFGGGSGTSTLQITVQ